MVMFMEEFIRETTTIWNFKERGDWSTHKGDYPGNCSPRAVRNLILNYTQKNDWILDQFVGSGTVAIESLLLNRRFIGIDINQNALNIAINRTECIKGKRFFRVGSAEKLKIKNETIDFICTHPPYRDIIKYSTNIKGDLSLMNENEFFKAMNNVASECFRVLKNNCKCAIIMGDIREKGYIYPLGFNIMNIFINNGFLLKEIIIKEQHNCKGTKKWNKIALKKNFYLIQHEYIFIFEKCLNKIIKQTF